MPTDFGEVYYFGIFSQIVTNIPPITGMVAASTAEETALTDTDLIALFAVAADDEGNTVIQKISITILEEELINPVYSPYQIDNPVDVATDSENKDNSSEEVESEQAGVTEDSLLATTGSKSITLFLVASLILFTGLKFDFYRCYI